MNVQLTEHVELCLHCITEAGLHKKKTDKRFPEIKIMRNKDEM